MFLKCWNGNPFQLILRKSKHSVLKWKSFLFISKQYTSDSGIRIIYISGFFPLNIGSNILERTNIAKTWEKNEKNQILMEL